MNLRVLEQRRTEPATRPQSVRVNVRALEADLRAAVSGEVRFDRTSRAIYSTDASNYRQVPIGVVIPRSKDDIMAAVAACNAHGAPILARGGGTSLAGQTCNVAVVFDTSKYFNRILEIDGSQRIARVEPGLVLDDLRDRAMAEHGLTFGPDPSTHTHCTLGGMIGNNSCGIHSVLAGRTADNVEALEILTYDGHCMSVGKSGDEALAQAIDDGGRRGEIYGRLRDLRDRYEGMIRKRYPDIPRRVSGYNLDALLPEHGFDVAKALVGSECTCAFVLEATVRLVPWPSARTLVVVGYPDVYEAGDDVPRILEHEPIGLEGIDDHLVRFMQSKDLHPQDIGLLPKGGGWLLVEFGGDSKSDASDKARAMMDSLEHGEHKPNMKLFDDESAEARVWEIRESGLGATAFVPASPDSWPGWEDAAVDPQNVGAYLREFRSLLDEFRYDCALYGHFGDGCIHCRIPFDLQSHDGIAAYRRFIDRAADLVLKHGGSLSGEHGDGQSRGALLEKMYGPELVDAFREFKTIWDPDWRMNPGKVIDPDPPDANLRLGTAYAPDPGETQFQFPDDHGSFARAALRCVGVGKCRRTHDAFMCPSYLGTHDEKDTTRGRARALFEMLNGELRAEGWRSEAVHEALDLCVGCKGCKKDCPVDVDMATYKAEFLSHYHAGRLRPRHHYAMGWIGMWVRLASSAPALANFFAHRPPFARWAKWCAGVDASRELPAFAKQTFTAWFRQRGRQAKHDRPVVLLVDAFNDHFFPDTLRAATEVLEHFGYGVVVPQWELPAIRPLLHYGMLKAAKARLRETVTRLSRYARAGTPIVGVEPSTVSVYREELHGLFPNDLDGQRLSACTMLLSELLVREDVSLPRIGGKAVFHGHCHQKAVLDAGAARTLLERMGIEYVEPQEGCCGMAGSFGYEAGEHCDLSRTIAEQNLLPAVRSAGRDDLIVIEGFSCREQIKQGTGRSPMHMAEVIAGALRTNCRPASQRD